MFHNINFVYPLIFICFVIQTGISVYLYVYIIKVDTRCLAVINSNEIIQNDNIINENIKKCLQRVKRSSTSVIDNSVSANTDEPHAEFFDPKLRSEIEIKDNITKKPGEGESSSNPWVWLTSYSRIPVSIQYLVSL